MQNLSQCDLFSCLRPSSQLQPLLPLISQDHFTRRRPQNADGKSHPGRQRLEQKNATRLPAGVSNLYLEVMHGCESNESDQLPWRLPELTKQMERRLKQPPSAKLAADSSTAARLDNCNGDTLENVKWDTVVDLLGMSSSLQQLRRRSHVDEGAAGIVGTQIQVRNPSRWRSLETDAFRWRSSRVNSSLSQPNLQQRCKGSAIEHAASLSRILQSPTATNLSLDVPEQVAKPHYDLTGWKNTTRLPSLHTKRRRNEFADVESNVAFHA